MFSKYDAGVKLDSVGWFSLTPEPVSVFMASYAKKYEKCVVIDGCCSVGGNTI